VLDGDTQMGVTVHPQPLEQLDDWGRLLAETVGGVPVHGTD
jgi:hypothetical protein